MPVHVWWRLESQNLHRHQKNQTTRCTKPAQASKKTKKTKLWASTQGWGSIDHKSFVFLGFFWCLCRFCEDHALFFLFFLMPVQVLWRSCFLLFVFLNACACFVKVSQDEKKKKHAFHQHFRPFRCIKHCKLQCFVLIFFQKPPPHGGPLSIFTTSDFIVEILKGMKHDVFLGMWCFSFRIRLHWPKKDCQTDMPMCLLSSVPLGLLQMGVCLR